jgi:hypothetical protein
MPSFISGRELSRRFYEEAVRPLLEESFPDLLYTAALIGPGSDVLGFDTEMSMDHDWGPRLLIILRDEDEQQRDAIREMLSYRLPHEFMGYPSGSDAAPAESRTHIMRRPVTGPVKHNVIVILLRHFLAVQLGYDIDRPLEAADWLTFPSNSLLEITDGAVYHDGSGELSAWRERLAWYPFDVRLYLLASGWQRIGQEEHLMPRAGFVGDELGSAIIGSRLVRDVMNLCFLMEKRYAPYPKWFGTAFKQLNCAERLWPVLWRAQVATTWREREAALGEAYEVLARMHNALGITQSMPENVSHFYERPFQVIQGGVFAETIARQISDPEVKAIAARRLIGNIDQFSDSTDLRGIERLKLRELYR